MKRFFYIALLLLIGCGPGVVDQALGATHVAASCSHTDVQAKITLAVSGDAVTVPAGNCTWTTTVTIASKALTLTGAGIGVTNITDQGSGGAALSVTGASTSNFVDVSGFTFIASTAHSNGMVQLSGTQFSENAFRFHDNRIVASVGRGVFVYYTYGLIDNNAFEPACAVQGLTIHGGSGSGADGGFIPWQQPLTLGSNKAVYIEDNSFTKTAFGSCEDAVDAYLGARLVIRHNAFTNTKWGFHGTDSGGFRSPVSFEIYSNDMYNDTGTNAPYSGRIRGGTGVIYSNTTHTGTWTGGYQLVYYRACNIGVTIWWGETGCDGTQYELGSTSLSSDLSRRACDAVNGGAGNNPPSLGPGGCEFFPLLTWAAHVRFCSLDPDTLCTGDASCAAAGKGTCTRYLDGTGTGGYPGRDQPGVGPGQVATPIYAWNNTGKQVEAYDLGTTNNCNTFGLTNYLLAGRDYYTNTQHPTYVAYTYPHPLRPDSAPDPDPIAGTPSISTFHGSTFAIFIWPRSTDAAHKAYNVYRCTTSGACNVLVKTITPASAAAAHQSETMFYDTKLYEAGTYWYSVADVNMSDIVGPHTTPVSITVTGK